MGCDGWVWGWGAVGVGNGVVGGGRKEDGVELGGEGAKGGGTHHIKKCREFPTYFCRVTRQRVI